MASDKSRKEDRTWRIGVVLILMLALALRIAYLLQLQVLPIWESPIGDSAVYLARAREILAGNLLASRPAFYGSIIYPYLIASMMLVAKGNLVWIGAVQIIAGTAVVGLLATLVRRGFGVNAGLCTGVLAALYGPFAFLEADLIGVVWALLALTGALLACQKWIDRSGEWRWLAAAGLCLGLAVLERPNLALVVPAVLVWCLRAPLERRLRPAAALVACAAAPLVLVTVVSAVATGRLVPLTTSAGINLSIGYHAGAPGSFEEPWEREDRQFSAEHTDLETSSVLMAGKRLGRPVTAEEASRYWAGEALQFISSNPLEALAITLRKLGLLFNSAEVSNHLDFAFVRQEVPGLRFMPIGFAIAFILAAAGVVAVFQRRETEPLFALLLWVAAAIVLSVLPFFVADRYRAPLLIPMLAMGGVGAAYLMERLQRISAFSAASHGVLASACLAAWVIASLPLFVSEPSRNYWMLARVHEARGDLEAAARSYESAASKGSDDAAVLNNLALIYRRMGDTARQIATLRRAVAADSTLAHPRRNLAMALIGSGDLKAALAELVTAARLSPDNPQILGPMGAVRIELGDSTRGAQELLRAARLAPQDSALAGLVRHYRPAL